MSSKTVDVTTRPRETATGSGRRFMIRPTRQRANYEPLSEHDACAALVQPIVILRGCAALALGRVSVKTPSSRLALIFSWSTLFAVVKT
jgi:hypothetical protein